MPIFDQFETEPYATYSGSYTDNIVYSRPITEVYLSGEVQSLGLVIASNRLGVYDNINRLVMGFNDRLDYVSGSWPKGQQKNIAVPYFSSENIFDSFPPAPPSIIKRDGYTFPYMNFNVSASQAGTYLSVPLNFGRFNNTSSLYTYANQISSSFYLSRPSQSDRSVNIIYPGVASGEFSSYAEDIYEPVSQSLNTKAFADLVWLSSPYPFKSKYKDINKLYNINSRYPEPITITQDLKGDTVTAIQDSIEIGSLHIALTKELSGSGLLGAMNDHRFFSEWSQIWCRDITNTNGEHRFLKSYNSLYGVHYFLTGTLSPKTYERCVAAFGEGGTILQSSDPHNLNWEKIASRRPAGYATDLPLQVSGYGGFGVPSPSFYRILGGILNHDQDSYPDIPYRWILVQDTETPGIIRATNTNGYLSRDQWTKPSSVGTKWPTDTAPTNVEYSNNFCYAVESANTLTGRFNNGNPATGLFSVSDSLWTDILTEANWKTIAVGRGNATPGTGGNFRGAILVSDGQGDVWYASQATSASLPDYTWVDIVAGPPISGSSEIFPSDQEKGAVRYIVVGFSGSNETNTPGFNPDRKSKVLISSGPPYLGYYRAQALESERNSDTWFDITDPSVIPDGVGLYSCDYDPINGCILVAGEDGFIAKGTVNGPTPFDSTTITTNDKSFGPFGSGKDYEVTWNIPTIVPKYSDGTNYKGRFVSIRLEKLAIVGNYIAIAVGEDGETFVSELPYDSWTRFESDKPAIELNNPYQYPRIESSNRSYNIWGGSSASSIGSADANIPKKDPIRRFNRGIGPTELINIPALTLLAAKAGLPLPSGLTSWDINQYFTWVGESIADVLDMYPASQLTKTNLFLKVSDAEHAWFDSQGKNGSTREPMRYFMSGANLIKPKNSDIYKVFFGFGDGLDLDLSDTIRGEKFTGIGKRNKLVGFKNFSYYDLYSNRTNGSYEVGQLRMHSPILRGWRYGLWSGLQTQSKVYFRRGKFGQFRDILEQRPFTRYIQFEQVNPTANPKLGQKVKTTVDGPIQVTFVSSSAIYSASIDYLTATNPAYNPYDSGIYDIYYRSGQPFFDRPNED